MFWLVLCTSGSPIIEFEVSNFMHIPLIEDLLKAPLTPGSSLLVEYDPTAAWYQASLGVATGWLKTGGVVTYGVTSQPPDTVRSQLTQLGLNVKELESNDKLRVFDWYTATLGRKSSEKYAFYSLKAADLSVLFSKYLMATEPDSIDSLPPTASPDWLRILDDLSCLSRFNEEKSWVEFVRTRLIPIGPLWKSTGIAGLIKGVHSDWVYKSLEAACDGVIDVKLDETSEEARTMMRIRSMRNVGFDSRWHPLKVNENLEVRLE
jgi:KaiC/GvpD/RAD55 family RecA-like ATPase